MTALIRRGSANKKYAARRVWLAARPERYVNVPGIHDDVTDTGRIALDTLHKDMLILGLFGASQGSIQREAIRRLVSELRGEQIEVGW